MRRSGGRRPERQCVPLLRSAQLASCRNEGWPAQSDVKRPIAQSQIQVTALPTYFEYLYRKYYVLLMYRKGLFIGLCDGFGDLGRWLGFEAVVPMAVPGRKEGSQRHTELSLAGSGQAGP